MLAIQASGLEIRKGNVCASDNSDDTDCEGDNHTLTVSIETSQSLTLSKCNSGPLIQNHLIPSRISVELLDDSNWPT